MRRFGMPAAKKCHINNPNLNGNIIDYATMNKLIYLAI